MKNSRWKQGWGAVLGAAVLTSVVAGGFAVAADEFTGDPEGLDWYTADTASIADPHRVDAPLGLYDATGTAVTEGALGDPLPAFAATDGKVRDGDSFGSLFVHAADSGLAAGAWPGVQVTGTTAYAGANPASAPAALAGDPYVATAGGGALGDIVSGFADADGDTFVGVYELRLRTSSATDGVSTDYASAYLKVTGQTWQVVDGPTEEPTEPTTEPTQPTTEPTQPTTEPTQPTTSATPTQPTGPSAACTAAKDSAAAADLASSSAAAKATKAKAKLKKAKKAKKPKAKVKKLKAKSKKAKAAATKAATTAAEAKAAVTASC